MTRLFLALLVGALLVGVYDSVGVGWTEWEKVCLPLASGGILAARLNLKS